MHQLTTDEVTALGDRFGVPVEAAELAAVHEQTNAFLASLDGLEDLPLPGESPDVSGRTWDAPTADRHNALTVECDVRGPAGAGGALTGLAVGLKEIIAVAGVPMQCGSAVMRGFVPSFDAAVVERLLDAGAHVVAMLNCDEFAGCAWGTTGDAGPIRNPHDTERTAGGSSGGSAAAVAAGRVDVALGTDTGGSIRMPAGFCGVVGLKPTYGLVPLHGVVENTYTQDHVGPLAGSVADAARVLEAIAGPDDRDPASLQAAGRADARYGGYVDAVSAIPAVDDLAIGRFEPGFGEGVARPVAEGIRAALDALADAGASVVPVAVDGFEHGDAVKNALSVTELAAHWRVGGAPYRRGGIVDGTYQASLADRAAESGGELGPYYQAKLLAGAHLIEAHRGRPYTRAQAARETLRERVERALADVDVLACPTMPVVAPRIEEVTNSSTDYARNTRLADVTRHPAITLPAGAVDGLPVGLQLVGEAFGEGSLLGVAAAVERELDGQTGVPGSR